jgi:hypothetical protein
MLLLNLTINHSRCLHGYSEATKGNDCRFPTIKVSLQRGTVAKRRDCYLDPEERTFHLFSQKNTDLMLAKENSISK